MSILLRAATGVAAALLLSGGDAAGIPRPAAPGSDGAQALEQARRQGFLLRVHKEERRLDLVSPANPSESQGILRSWPVGLGFSPAGDKVREGDGRTPEGRFRVSGRIPKSQFYKAFLLSYPEVEDAERGLRDGIVSASQAEAIRLAHEEGRPPPHDTPLGGLVEIHGSGSGSDWTLGCVAMDDEAIDELWGIVRVGTWVEIRP